MDISTLVDEIEEMIARIEKMNRAERRDHDITSARAASSPSRRLHKSRQARLWWLRQVRDGILAEKPRAALLH